MMNVHNFEYFKRIMWRIEQLRMELNAYWCRCCRNILSSFPYYLIASRREQMRTILFKNCPHRARSNLLQYTLMIYLWVLSFSELLSVVHSCIGKIVFHDWGKKGKCLPWPAVKMILFAGKSIIPTAKSKTGARSGREQQQAGEGKCGCERLVACCVRASMRHRSHADTYPSCLVSMSMGQFWLAAPLELLATCIWN